MPVSIADALEVFARGFAFTRSMTHPYIAERLDGGVWVVRDAPRTRRGDAYRGEEYIASGVEPAALDALAKAQTRGRYSICAILPIDEVGGERERELRAAYAAMDYRLRTTEALMTRNLESLDGLPAMIEAPEGIAVRRVTTAAEATSLAKAARRRQVLPEHLSSDGQPAPPQRQYVAWADGETPIGWVASIPVGEWAWCSNMYVAPTHRRRGIARALLQAMLADDRATGARANVLLASHAGAKLYPVVGYHQIGTLFAFMPKGAGSGTDQTPGCEG